MLNVQAVTQAEKSNPTACTSGSQLIFMQRNLFLGIKIASLQKSIVPIGRDGFLVGVVVAGEILPRHQRYAFCNTCSGNLPTRVSSRLRSRSGGTGLGAVS